jgi:two-component system, NarL family, invasion response regulator UvrY
MTRILLADDHDVVRKGLKQILMESMPETHFGDASSGREALRQARAEPWDLVVLDISLPDRSGLDVLKELRRDLPALPVLVLSMYSEEQFAVRVLRAGAAGYLTKRTAAQELIAAVRKVLAGGKYVSASVAESLAVAVGVLPPSAADLHEALSDREYQVFRMLAMGKTVKDIGEELFLSPQTVSTHRGRILDKMGMTTNAELTQYAIQSGLLT